MNVRPASTPHAPKTRCQARQESFSNSMGAGVKGFLICVFLFSLPLSSQSSFWPFYVSVFPPVAFLLRTFDFPLKGVFEMWLNHRSDRIQIRATPPPPIQKPCRNPEFTFDWFAPAISAFCKAAVASSALHFLLACWIAS